MPMRKYEPCDGDRRLVAVLSSHGFSQERIAQCIINQRTKRPIRVETLLKAYPDELADGRVHVANKVARALFDLIDARHPGAVLAAAKNYLPGFGQEDGAMLTVSARASALEQGGLEVRFVKSTYQDESGDPLPDGSQPYSAQVIDLEANRDAAALPHPGHYPPPFSHETVGDTPKAEIPLTESKPAPAAISESPLPKPAVRKYEALHPEVIRDQSYRLPHGGTELDNPPEPKRSSSGGFSARVLAGQCNPNISPGGIQWGGKWRGPKPK